MGYGNFIASIANLEAIIQPLIISSILLNISITSRNIKHDRGSPCLNPLEDLRKPLGLPFAINEKVGEEMHFGIIYAIGHQDPFVLTYASSFLNKIIHSHIGCEGKSRERKRRKDGERGPDLGSHVIDI